MKAEQYLIEYMEQNNISVKQLERDMGLNLEKMLRNEQELNTDEFMTLCMYLGVDADDVMNSI